ncbi:hypothetical protein L1049_004045 [Liquidambar formosana]|uniref:FAS1 domain-containing protein n=1 Tax=Liquidambar formosana TaxID=63359 RepID=A0AAP0RMK9_LIQFO
MTFKHSLLLLFFFLFRSSTAFNITKLLGQYPDFSSYNDQLTQTQLAGEISSRQTITILAVDNTAMGSLSGKSTDAVKMILSLHVVLDYYDVPKLQKMSNKTSLLATLFQASGQATGQQGFLNVTDLSGAEVAFGSAVPGSSLGAKLVKAVVSQPFNVSVLQISSIVIPPGIGNSKSNSTPSTAPSATPSKSPSPATSVAPSTSGKAPAPSVAKTPSAAPPKSDSGETPSAAPSGNSSATPSDAPSINAGPPSDADAPSSDADAPDSDGNAPSVAKTPTGSPPSPSIASGPMTDAPAPEGKSAATPAAFGIHLAVLMMVAYSAWSLTSAI